ncbi:MAG: hypothetical protein M3M94_06010 [Actinomycetota bacterium]|nr:hypothetical protein [Actinomycetota bacterium]
MKLLDELEARKARHKDRGRAYRISFAVIGAALILLGGVLSLPLVPGPGLPLLVLGLAMLALEFDWAERVLASVLVRADRTRARVQSSRWGGVLTAVALAIVASGAIAAIVLWDVPLLPV